MEWWIIVTLLAVVAVILFPAAFIWYLNIGGLYTAIREKRVSLPIALIRRVLIALGLIAPVGVYVFAIWYSFRHIGWPIALAVGLAFPIVVAIAVGIWVGVVSGLFVVLRTWLRRRSIANRGKMASTGGVPVSRGVA
jgi:uncharacterized membrane protein (UPF0182 family)